MAATRKPSSSSRLEAESASVGVPRTIGTIGLAGGGKPAARDAPDVELDVGRFRPAPEGGFQSTIALRVPAGSDVTWQRLERVVRGWGDETRTVTLPWAEAVRVDERLERGGFRGEVRVGGDDAGSGVKQVHDTLYGRDASGPSSLRVLTASRAQKPASSAGLSMESAPPASMTSASSRAMAQAASPTAWQGCGRTTC